MNPADHRLTRHLVTAVLVKLVALLAIWWWFVRDARIELDTDAAAARLLSTADRSADAEGARQ